MKKMDSIDGEISKTIENYSKILEAIDITSEDKDYIEAGLVMELIDDQKFLKLKPLAEMICEKISEHFANSESLLATVFMNLGMVKTGGALACYEPFFDTINKHKDKKIARAYNNVEGERFNDLCDEIKEITGTLQNKNFLVIVDKKLGNSQDGNAVITDLRERFNNTNIFFSVLFTSQKSDAPVVPLTYFHFEIQKPENNEESLKRVSEGLALCAFAVLFDELSRLNINAHEKAKKLVLESGKETVLYLVSMAKVEGEHVFSTINNWFSLLAEKNAQDELFSLAGSDSKFKFIEGVVSLVDLDFFNTEVKVGNPEFEKIIQDLSGFELFDYQVNLTHSPPAPGDIYSINDELYILAGQECDLVIRNNQSKVCRKDKLAEMVKCNNTSLLWNSKIHDDKATLVFNYFLFKEKYGALKINLGEKDFFDFKLLDLCSLNENGEANYFEDGSLPENIENALPDKWREYHPGLLKELQEKVKIQKVLKEAEISTECIAIEGSLSLEATTEDGIVSFPARRVARLKGRFKEYFLRRYWEYKTRMGLNNILNSNLESTTIENIEYGFHNNLNQKEVNLPGKLQRSHNRDTNDNKSSLPLIFNKGDVSHVLEEPFKARLQALSLDEIIIGKTKVSHKESKIIIDKRYENDKWKIEIVFPYSNEISSSSFFGKDSMALFDVFPAEFIAKLGLDNEATCTIDGEEHRLFNDKGYPQKKFTVDELKLGIYISSAKLGFKLDEGIGSIVETKYEEPTKIEEDSDKE